MANMKEFVLGVVPTRRDAFKNALKAEVLELTEKLAKKHHVKTVGIEGLVDEGLLFKNEDVPKVAEHLIKAGVDGVFVPHANFGQEEAVAKLCKAVGKPVLVWGPRDPAPKGVMNQQEDRLYDVQCGLFATGRALISYNVPFTYVENCWLDSPVIDKGFGDFIRTASAVKAFKTARIGQISVRPRQFLTVKYNESELLEKFGVEVVPIGPGELFGEMRKVLDEKNAVKAKIEQWKAYVDLSKESAENVEKMAAANIAIRAIADRYQCTVMAGECWMTLRMEFGIGACFIWGSLTDEGLPVICENDVLGALTAVTVQALGRGESPVFFADLTIRHPENDNAELLWHCGPYPMSLAKKECGPCVFQDKGQFEIVGGDITLARIGATHGKYLFFAGEAKGVEGPKTNGTYIWAETENWPAWERKFVCGPYIHHIVGIHGKYQAALHETLKYLGEIEPDCVG